MQRHPLPSLRLPLLLLMALGLAGTGCSDDTAANNATKPPCTGQTCQTTGTGTSTAGGTSTTGGTNGTNGTSSGGMCAPNRPECGTMCCGRGYACSEEQQCECPSATVCNGVCCGAGQVCETGVCVDPSCTGTRCGAELELCCAGQDICLNGSCVAPGIKCEFKEDCQAGEDCDSFLGQCVPESTTMCEYRPTPGDFMPEIACEWSSQGLIEPTKRDVVMAPVVLDLADEGEPEGEEIPEIAFISFDVDVPAVQGGGCCNSKGVLRIVSGKCEGKTIRTIASVTEPALSNDVGIAAGDLDGDGVPEIVGVMNKKSVNAAGATTGFYAEGLVAFKRDNDKGTSWSPLWRNEDKPGRLVHIWTGGPTISIADIDGDAKPEVVVGSVVFDGQTGKVKWDAAAGFKAGDPVPGQGHNLFGPVSSVVDVDQDGKMEVFAGSTLYNFDGTVRARYDYEQDARVGLTRCLFHKGDGTLTRPNVPITCDGYSGVADIDVDGSVDLVSVRLGEIFVWNADMTLQWKVAVPTFDKCLNKATGMRNAPFNGNESGPPTIADFDGDGKPEIGTAGATYYVVADRDCDTDDWQAKGCAERGILWKTENQDCSSRSTASSVFDFEGDGKAEVVYVDEENLFIYDGQTGKILFKSGSMLADAGNHRSNTRIEMPIVADVDNDNNAEIVMGSAWLRRGGDDLAIYDKKTGLKIWKDARDNWVRTRRIWNQHSYHVTNVNADGTIPTKERAWWTIPALNSYRQNIQPSGLFDAPDLIVQSIDFNRARCLTEGELEVYVAIANDGSLGIADGLAYTVYALIGSERIKLGEEKTTQRLFPGQAVRKSYTFSPPAGASREEITIEVKVDTENAHNECKEDNNTLEAKTSSCAPLG